MLDLDHFIYYLFFPYKLVLYSLQVIEIFTVLLTFFALIFYSLFGWVVENLYKCKAGYSLHNPQYLEMSL